MLLKKIITYHLTPREYFIGKIENISKEKRGMQMRIPSRKGKLQRLKSLLSYIKLRDRQNI